MIKPWHVGAGGVGYASQILREASTRTERNQLKPPMAQQQFSPGEIASAYDLVAIGSKGKVVLEL